MKGKIYLKEALFRKNVKISLISSLWSWWT